MIATVIASFFLVFSSASARVFSFKDLQLGSMLRGSAGTIAVSQLAYGDGMGSNTTFSVQPDYGFSGEVGAVILGETTNVVLSLEYLVPSGITGAEGTLSGSSKLLTLDSSVHSIIGWLGVEFLMRPRPKSRIIWGIYGGGGQTFLHNSVTLTGEGINQFPTASRYFEEQASGYGYGAKSMIGWEFLFTDNVTLTTEIGYRYFMTTSLTHTTDVDSIAGSASKGSPLKNSDGTVRSLDLSGAIFGLCFRFYF